MDFAQPVKALAVRELVEVQRQRGFSVDGLKGERAFQVQRDVRENFAALANRGAHIDALRAFLPPDLDVFAQSLHALGRDFDADARHGAGGKKVVACLVVFAKRMAREQRQREEQWQQCSHSGSIHSIAQTE